MSLITETEVVARIGEILLSSVADSVKLKRTMRLLAKYRSLQMQIMLVEAQGLKVSRGPFEGMTFLPHSAEGCHIPKLLGCYEAELQPHLMAAAQRGYDVVINIGAAEGYYAVGLARLMPAATVYAHDTNPAAQAACRELARKNDVADRIIVGGLFAGEDFATFADRRVLIVCDIEGAEMALLDPEKFPALRHMDIIVELHDRPQTKISKILSQRFVDSHDVHLEAPRAREVDLPPVFQELGHLDQLLAIWEWRTAPTPWAVMLANHQAQRQPWTITSTRT